MKNFMTYRRVELLLSTQRYELAIDELGRALGDSPDDDVLHGLLAESLRCLERYDEATAAIEQAISLDPESDTHLICQAKILLERNRFAAARAAAVSALELDSWNPVAHKVIAACLLRERRYAKALESIDSALHQEPDDVDAMAIKVEILRKLDRHPDADAVSETMLQEDPDDEWAHYQRGEALMMDAKYDAAMVHFREALRIDPMFEAPRYAAFAVLKTRYRLFRWLSTLLFQFAKLPKAIRWTIIGVAIALLFLLPRIRRANPEFAIPLLVFHALILGLAIALWLAEPLLHLLMLATREGRQVLPDLYRKQARLFGICFAVMIAFLMMLAVVKIPIALLLWPYSLAAMMAGLSVYECQEGWPRTVMMWAMLISLAACLLVPIGMVIGGGPVWFQARVLIAILFLYRFKFIWFAIVAVMSMTLDEVSPRR